MKRGAELLQCLLKESMGDRYSENDIDTYQLMRDVLMAGVHDKDYGFYMYQWIDYKECGQYRLKMLHDLKLNDGTVLLNMYPNATKWTCLTTNEGDIDDKDVAFIRVCKNQIGDEFR